MEHLLWMVRNYVYISVILYIYIHMCVCDCVCVFAASLRKGFSFEFGEGPLEI